MTPTFQDPPALTDREVRFFASHYMYHLSAVDKLSVSLIQRRFLLGFYAATQVHDYISKVKTTEQIRANFEDDFGASPSIELTLSITAWLADQLVKKPLSVGQILLHYGDVCKLTAPVPDSTKLDQWLLINSDSILNVEKRFL